MKALLHIAVYFIYQCFLISAQITGDSDVQCNDKLIQQILDQQQLILDKLDQLENATEEIYEDVDRPVRGYNFNAYGKDSLSISKKTQRDIKSYTFCVNYVEKKNKIINCILANLVNSREQVISI